MLVAARNPYPASHVLTKTWGDTIDMRWGVRNTGGAAETAWLRYTDLSGRSVPLTHNSTPVSIPPGGQTVGLIFLLQNISYSVHGFPGTNSIALEIIKSTGAPVVAAHTWQLNLPALATQAEVIAEGQRRAGSLSNPDTRWVIGTVLSDWGLLNVSRQFVDNLPGESGRTWFGAMDWWMQSGHIIPGTIG